MYSMSEFSKPFSGHLGSVSGAQTSPARTSTMTCARPGGESNRAWIRRVRILFHEPRGPQSPSPSQRTTVAQARVALRIRGRVEEGGVVFLRRHPAGHDHLEAATAARQLLQGSGRSTRLEDACRRRGSLR